MSQGRSTRQFAESDWVNSTMSMPLDVPKGAVKAPAARADRTHGYTRQDSARDLESGMTLTEFHDTIPQDLLDAFTEATKGL